MKSIALFVVLFAAAAHAQQPSNEEINARIQILVAQRNEAQNQVVQVAAQATVLAQELEKAKREAQACKADEK